MRTQHRKVSWSTDQFIHSSLSLFVHPIQFWWPSDCFCLLPFSSLYPGSLLSSSATVFGPFVVPSDQPRRFFLFPLAWAVMTEGGEMAVDDLNCGRYTIVWPKRGGPLHWVRFLTSTQDSAFVESSVEPGPVRGDYRWVIFVSIVVRRLIALLGKPLRLLGLSVEFVLNLLSQNAGFLGLLSNLFRGKQLHLILLGDISSLQKFELKSVELWLLRWFICYSVKIGDAAFFFLVIELQEVLGCRGETRLLLSVPLAT